GGGLAVAGLILGYSMLILAVLGLAFVFFVLGGLVCLGINGGEVPPAAPGSVRPASRARPPDRPPGARVRARRGPGRPSRLPAAALPHPRARSRLPQPGGPGRGPGQERRPRRRAVRAGLRLRRDRHGHAAAAARQPGPAPVPPAAL